VTRVTRSAPTLPGELGRSHARHRESRRDSPVRSVFNLAGEPFEVPATAGGWRMRRLKPKGPPEVVYGREGTPLVLPIDADMDALRREARAEGRYRLDPVDDRSRMIRTCAYQCIRSTRGDVSCRRSCSHARSRFFHGGPDCGRSCSSARSRSACCGIGCGRRCCGGTRGRT
jgi:hypothetical protein